jgi:hypothetical protein
MDIRTSAFGEVGGPKVPVSSSGECLTNSKAEAPTTLVKRMSQHVSSASVLLVWRRFLQASWQCPSRCQKFRSPQDRLPPKVWERGRRASRCCGAYTIISFFNSVLLTVGGNNGKKRCVWPSRQVGGYGWEVGMVVICRQSETRREEGLHLGCKCYMIEGHASKNIGISITFSTLTFYSTADK